MLLVGTCLWGKTVATPHEHAETLCDSSGQEATNNSIAG